MTLKCWQPDDTDFHVKVKESLLVSRDKPILNKNETEIQICCNSDF